MGFSASPIRLHSARSDLKSPAVSPRGRQARRSFAARSIRDFVLYPRI